MSDLLDPLPTRARYCDLGATMDGDYRYDLFRAWESDWRDSQPLYFVMLNPSTADGSEDDPTIRRCVGFAKTCGFRSLHVVNLYALRVTRPVHLWEHPDPVGPRNQTYLETVARRSVVDGGLVVAAWGTNAAEGEAERFKRTLAAAGASAYCLGRNKGDSPKHPLYVKADRALELWA